MSSPLDLLIPTPGEPSDEFRFGTVVSSSPVTVRFDGDAAPTPVATAWEPVRGGERVLVLAKRQQRIVVGVVGGTPAANLDLSKLLTTAGGTIDGPLTLNGALNVRTPGAILENGLTLDRLYGSGVTRYDHQYSYLIQTNLPAAGDHMWTLDVRFNTYGRASIDGTGWLWLQGYSYDATNSMMNSAGRSTIGPREARAFNYGGSLCFWVAPGGPYETAHFYLRNAGGSNNPAIIDVADSGLPGGRTREAIIDVRTIGYKTSWADVPATGASSGFTRYIPVQWRRADDMILLKGGVNRDAAGGWTADLAYTIGTLPVEARPPEQSPITIYSEPAGPTTPPVMGVVFPTGEINLKAGGTVNYWANIGGSFYAPLQ